eukprot:7705301-Karenia_brevis.AAC.1
MEENAAMFMDNVSPCLNIKVQQLPDLSAKSLMLTTKIRKPEQKQDHFAFEKDQQLHDLKETNKMLRATLKRSKLEQELLSQERQKQQTVATHSLNDRKNVASRST